MPARSKAGSPGRDEMPGTIERSDKHAQDIWAETHDSAVETYGEGEAAHRVAFASLKHSYRKEGDRWVAKPQKGPSDPQAARGPDTPMKSTEEPRAPTAGGKVARTAREAREKAKQARRDDAQARRSREKRERK
ncbi:MAG: ChaB family protein [Chloroflexota bacterium]|nr:ChaB family protein [Chloroflexota bacterium]